MTITEDEKKKCAHVYFRVILECTECGQQITNVNRVRYKIPNSDDYIYERYKPYRFDSSTRKLTD